VNDFLRLLRDFWQNLKANEKRGLVIFGISLLVIFLGTASYMARTKAPEEPQIEKDVSLNMNTALLEKTIYAQGKLEQDKRTEELNLLRKELEELKKSIEEENDKAIELYKVQDDPPVRQQSSSFFPPPPPPPPLPPPPATPVFTGSIEVVSGQGSIIKPSADPDPDKDLENKKQQKIYLPPSFMEATLLSGLDARTVESARNDPEPVLLRVKDMAILPNEIKSNLKGCFVIAHGFGSLDNERVFLRLISLSCIANSGLSIIDQTIKGFVVDADGKIGLRGTVITKMGSAIARSFLAGFFGGAGDALKASSATTAISPLGTTQSIVSSKDLAKAAVGGGISQSASELQKFYLELARQTMPIIEVGATKAVTLVISEGVELKIKDSCFGEEAVCKMKK